MIGALRTYRAVALFCVVVGTCHCPFKREHWVIMTCHALSRTVTNMSLRWGMSI